MGRLINLTSKRYNHLTVIERDFDTIKLHSSGTKLVVWRCRCDCGKIHSVSAGLLKNNRVRSCGCSKSNWGDQHSRWKGVGSIGQHTYAKIVSHAKDRNIAVYITLEYISSLYDLQEGRCKLSGIKLQPFGKNRTISLDRIDSNKPYEEGNVQWIHKKINMMKWKLSQEEFIEFCKLIASHNQ